MPYPKKLLDFEKKKTDNKKGKRGIVSKLTRGTNEPPKKPPTTGDT